jgi:hypothetical protein
MGERVTIELDDESIAAAKAASIDLSQYNRMIDRTGYVFARGVRTF